MMGRRHVKLGQPAHSASFQQAEPGIPAWAPHHRPQVTRAWRRLGLTSLVSADVKGQRTWATPSTAVFVDRTGTLCCRPLLCVAACSPDRLPPTRCSVVADIASYTIRPPRYILVPFWVVCSSKRASSRPWQRMRSSIIGSSPIHGKA